MREYPAHEYLGLNPAEDRTEDLRTGNDVLKFLADNRVGGGAAVMRTLPQEHHCDLGIVDDDHTEDLRTTKNALGRCWNTAEGYQNRSTTT